MGDRDGDGERELRRLRRGLPDRLSFGERGGATAVLKGDWKGVRRNTRNQPDGPIEIYNLKNDLSETNNLAKSQPELIEEFKAALKREHIPLDRN